MLVFLLSALAAPTVEQALEEVAETGTWHAEKTGYAGIRTEYRETMDVLIAQPEAQLAEWLDHDSVAVRYLAVRALKDRGALEPHLTEDLRNDTEVLTMRAGCVGYPTSIADLVNTL